MRKKQFALVVFGAAALLFCGQRAALAVHDADVTDDELKCQIGTSLAQGKFVVEAAKCSTKCQAGARKAANPISDCAPPFAGAMLTCVNLATSKAIGLEGSKCAKDCPECYAGGDCAADAATRTATNQTQLNAFGPFVYCDDSGSGDGLSKVEAKCADTVAKTLSKFVAALGKCGQKCAADEHKGKTPVGSCTPPATDAKEIACINAATTKATSLIDGKCADAPDCFLPNLDTGTEFVTTVGGIVQAAYGQTYCGE